MSDVNDQQPAPPRRVQRVRHEVKRRQLEVLRVRDLSPHIRAVTFGGESLAGFLSPAFDDHVKLILDTGDAGPAKRDYTPRFYDAAAGELTIEFALHGDGPATRWAAQARPGDRVEIGGPRGSFIVPFDYDWHLLVGDDTALPAIARRLEELPAGTRVIVIAQIEAADRRPLPTQANLTLTWVDDHAACLAAVRALELPPGDGYVWGAGEASEMAALRRVIVDEKKHNRRAIRAAAYWKRGAAGHHENLE
jgi:NADPH-dependent ferric siderophore reductase